MVQIVPYSSEYQDQVISLILDIQNNEFDISISAEDQPDICNISEFYQKEKGNFWLALISGKVVRTISLLDIGNGKTALRKMFVKKEHRGSEFDVAKLLLDETLNWSKSKNISEIYLGTTHKFLAAHHFYEKNGFESILKAMLPADFPIMKVDTIFYRYLF